MTEDCKPVEWGPTPEEIAAAVSDPTQARVVRPSDVNPAAPSDTPETRALQGLDLSAYRYRPGTIEAGVLGGGLYGRWFVSLSGSLITTNGTRIVRPSPTTFDNGRPAVLNSVLATGSIGALIYISGSDTAGNELLNETIAAPDVIEKLRLARDRNPHYAAVSNGSIEVDSARATIGCTVPKIRVSIDGLDRVYTEQSLPLWRAGIDEMRWIWDESRNFIKGDVYRQIGWTITPDVRPVSGTWEPWPWPWAVSDTLRYRDSFLNDISASIGRWYQPGTTGTEGDPLAQNRKRTEQFITEITDVWNRINADSNIIRGLQILGGNLRISQQRKRQPVFVQPTPGGSGGTGGGRTGGGGGVNDSSGPSVN